MTYENIDLKYFFCVYFIYFSTFHISRLDRVGLAIFFFIHHSVTYRGLHFVPTGERSRNRKRKKEKKKDTVELLRQ